MKNQKHTPGPWLLDEQSDDLGHSMAIIGCAGNGECIAIVADSENDLMLDNYKANAALIAAAPEMLEALEQVFKLLPASYDGLMMEQIENVINKAKGL